MDCPLHLQDYYKTHIQTDHMITKNRFMKPIIHLVLLSGILFISSCRTYYGDGLSGGIYTQMQTPMAENDQTVSKNYIGGKYNNDVSYYENEKNESGEISYHHAISKNRVNYAYGVFVFMGKYKVADFKNTLENLNNNYDYYGGGIRAKVAYNWPISRNVHWRIIGIQASWYMERGDYYEFKKYLIDLNVFEDEDQEMLKNMIGTVNDFTNITFYPYTELAFKIGDSWQITPHAGFGYKINRLASFRFFTGINISYKQISIWGSTQHIGSSLDRLINNDFIENNVGNNTHTQLGLAWSF